MKIAQEIRAGNVIMHGKIKAVAAKDNITAKIR